MSTEHSLILRLTITPADMAEALGRPAPGFDQYTDWEDLPIFIDDRIIREVRRFEGDTPGALLAEIHGYSKFTGGWMFQYDRTRNLLTLINLLNGQNWDEHLGCLCILRSLPAREGTIIIQDLISGSEEAQAIIEYIDGVGHVVDVDTPHADELAKQCADFARPILETLQAAGDGPIPSLPDSFPEWWPR